MKKFDELNKYREEFKSSLFDKAHTANDPIEQFGHWFDDVIKSGIPMPNAMAVSTASSEGHPSTRTLLVKDFSKRGFTFFTNYDSHKSKDLEENPRASLMFFWLALERQVQVEGNVTKLSREDSEAYFATRPRESQLGAWASIQSKTIPDRNWLEKRLSKFEEKFKGGNVPTPPNWGGYILIPNRLEFWQGRPNRLHDRIEYLLGEDGEWEKNRLSP